MKNLKIIKKCSYCQEEKKKLAGTPFLADIPAWMCEKCWKMTRENSGKQIPTFKSIF